MNIFKKIFLIIISASILFFLGYRIIEDSKNLASFGSADNYQNENKPEAVSEEKSAEIKIPAKIFISTPFTSQAPYAIWDEFHEEACEEASLIMLKYYLDTSPLSAETAEKEIQNLINFQIKKYGDYKDTDVAETIKLAKDYYGIENIKVVYDFQPEDLKKYLAQGKPIIVPAAGRLLKNPYFTSPGPLYHNLVLTGYNGNIIITNDPGTKRGENYKYDIKTLYNAIHDFPGRPEDIEKGRKAMIVVE
jgi:hypothetical protein